MPASFSRCQCARVPSQSISPASSKGVMLMTNALGSPRRFIEISSRDAWPLRSRHDRQHDGGSALGVVEHALEDGLEHGCLPGALAGVGVALVAGEVARRDEHTDAVAAA